MMPNLNAARFAFAVCVFAGNFAVADIEKPRVKPLVDCPPPAKTVRIETVQQLRAAARGEAPYDTDPPETEYVVAPGTYVSPTQKAVMWIKKGGSEKRRRVFRAEVRGQSVIYGRTLVSANHVQLQDLTFDLRGYKVSPNKSFSTVELAGVNDIVLNRLFCTGNGTKGRRGGHVEISKHGDTIPSDILVQDCVLEKFGRSQLKKGRLDHGVYISAANRVRLDHNVIRYNSGRGIQVYTSDGFENRIANLIIENSAIHDNGVQPYTDGILLSIGGNAHPATMNGVLIRNNLIYHNAFSGLRFAVPACRNVRIENNTFALNGKLYNRGGEVYLDDVGNGLEAVLTKNIFEAKHRVIGRWKNGLDMQFTDNVLAGPLGDSTAFEPSNRRVRKAVKNAKKGDWRVANNEWSDRGFQDN